MNLLVRNVFRHLICRGLNFPILSPRVLSYVVSSDTSALRTQPEVPDDVINLSMATTRRCVKRDEFIVGEREGGCVKGAYGDMRRGQKARC